MSSYLKLSAIILQREVKERPVYRDSCIIDQTRQRIGTKLFLDLESGPIHTLPVSYIHHERSKRAAKLLLRKHMAGSHL
jgi:hypothetical protein